MNRTWQTLLASWLLLTASQAGAVDYALPDMDGQLQSLDQYQGKWVIVNYWATWCGTCLKELARPCFPSRRQQGQGYCRSGRQF